MRTKQILQIAIVFLFSVLISSCLNTVENSLTAEPHFRQVWWGSTKASVLTKERGKRIYVNTGGALVYKTRYESVPMLLVYCFGSHNGIYRLRAAGYLTAHPVIMENPDKVFSQNLLDTLGEPAKTLPDGGLLWEDAETVIYTNSYNETDVRDIYEVSIPEAIIQPSRMKRLPGWHLIMGYIDRRFYEELQAAETWEFVLGELSYYEEIFFGMFRSLRQ